MVGAKHSHGIIQTIGQSCANASPLHIAARPPGIATRVARAAQYRHPRRPVSPTPPLHIAARAALTYYHRAAYGSPPMPQGIIPCHLLQD